MIPGSRESEPNHSRSETDIQTKLPEGSETQFSTGDFDTAPTREAPSEDRSGTSEGSCLFGKYRVLKELGVGGLGRVYLVRHLKLETDRALKTILPRIAGNPVWRQRFGREAKAMARLSHPNIVAVHDADVLPDGQAFIEMEYIRGQSLDKRINKGEPLPVEEVDRLLAQLADALQFAHDQGIVHRDLKPGNLMIQDGPSANLGTLKILDFGIAKILDSDDPDDEVTGTGESIGTPSYMSPEQIRGGYGTNIEGETLDFRTDIYAVGVILYQFLTGYLPFVGNKTIVLLAHLNEQVPGLSERNPEARIPPGIEALVLRCLAKNPRDRPHSMRELADEFHRLVQPSRSPPLTIDGPQALPLGQPQGRSKGRKAGWLVAAVLALAAVVGLMSPWFGSRRSKPLEKLPEAFEPADGFKPVQLLGNKSYPDRIVRKLPGGLTAEFILIPYKPGEDTKGTFWSYYIMKNKVSNALYKAYLQSDPVAYRKFEERLTDLRAKSDPSSIQELDDQWPAYGVSIPEIREFAKWLVPPGRGLQADLPSEEEWDKAAGAFMTGADRDEAGPFVRPPGKDDMDGIAINRDLPMPIGTAKLDLSPFGCRDMAGNGLEWTRPGDEEMVSLRGERYLKAEGETFQPYTFKASGNNKMRQTEGRWGIGFRLAIDNLEGAGPR